MTNQEKDSSDNQEKDDFQKTSRELLTDYFKPFENQEALSKQEREKATHDYAALTKDLMERNAGHVKTSALQIHGGIPKGYEGPLSWPVLGLHTIQGDGSYVSVGLEVRSPQVPGALAIESQVLDLMHGYDIDEDGYVVKSVVDFEREEANVTNQHVSSEEVEAVKLLLMKMSANGPRDMDVGSIT